MTTTTTTITTPPTAAQRAKRAKDLGKAFRDSSMKAADLTDADILSLIETADDISLLGKVDAFTADVKAYVMRGSLALSRWAALNSEAQLTETKKNSDRFNIGNKAVAEWALSSEGWCKTLDIKEKSLSNSIAAARALRALGKDLRTAEGTEAFTAEVALFIPRCDVSVDAHKSYPAGYVLEVHAFRAYIVRQADKAWTFDADGICRQAEENDDGSKLTAADVAAKVSKVSKGKSEDAKAVAFLAAAKVPDDSNLGLVVAAFKALSKDEQDMFATFAAGYGQRKLTDGHLTVAALKAAIK
tara:strand:+ start:415 stop:1314 length:900 start_codon:yes stop_codon:yes gene_type:complete